MADNFKSLFTTISLIGLFAFCIFSFIITFQDDNNQQLKINSNPVINKTYNSLLSNLSSMETITKSQKQSFDSESPTLSIGSLVIYSIISAGRIFGGLLIAIFNILIILPATFLGVSPVILGVLETITLIGIIIYLWSLWKAGS